MNENKELTQIVKIVQKDIGQFELLYSKIINKVYFWCYTVAGDESVAKDMSQEAMIRIYCKIIEVKQPEYFNSWMYRVVINSCITYFRNNKKYTTEMLYSDDFEGSFEANIKEERSDNLPEEAYNLKETKNLVKSFIDKLPRKQREVITLYYLEEFKSAEIADILGQKEVSVRSLLRSGRKSLELQVNEYQEKNHVKLYSTIILPLLGLILSEYRSDVCSKQNLQYEKSLYEANNTSLSGKMSKMLSNKMTIIITSIICASVTLVVIANVLQEHSSNSNGVDRNTSMVNDLEMFNKTKGHPYIQDISHLDFPMREGVDVHIELKKEVAKKDIKIEYNGEELSFEKKEEDILVQVTKNGIYTIITKGYETSFRIDNIDEHAPELVEAFNKKGYLLLIIKDELSQIDYQKTYIEYQGEKYAVPENLRINGEFHGIVKVTIVHQNGHKIEYVL